MLKSINFKNDTQRIMFEVIASLIPAVIYKTYVFGWLGVFAITTLLIAAIITEKTFAKVLNLKSDLGDYTSIITAILLFLTLSCNLTAFIYFIASFVAIGLGKMIYGGFAKNIFNPAMVGWCFVMVSFPQFLTKHLDYSTTLNFTDSLNIFLGLTNVDTYTSATPLNFFKIDSYTSASPTITQHHLEELLPAVPQILYLNLITLAGGLYILARRIISPVFPIALALGTLTALLSFDYDVDFIVTAELYFLYGPAILAAFYIVTDPVSSPSISRAQFVFSFFIGFISILIAKMGSYPIGMAFAVIFMNSFNFILDKTFATRKQ